MGEDLGRFRFFSEVWPSSSLREAGLALLLAVGGEASGIWKAL